MISMIKWLCIIPSRSRPHINDDNPYAESLHHHNAIKYLAPDEVLNGLAEERITNRVITYKKAYARHPERRSGKTRNWTMKKVVFFNPPKCKTT